MNINRPEIMTEQLLSYFNEFFDFTFSEKPPMNDFFTIEIKNKKEFLIKEGNLCNDIFFIINGYIRIFHLTEKGEEITTDIFRRGEMVSSMYSLLKKAPSFENVQCINDCKLYRVSDNSFKELRANDPQWFQLGFKILKQELIKKEERIRDFTKLKAYDRYLKLLDEKQDVIQNVPVQYLASYIGVKPESLSRLKNQYAVS